MSKIYRDFDHYWTEGDHPWSSASYDIAKEEWERFAPTIHASLDDYKEMYIELCNEQANAKSDLITAMMEYIDIFVPENAPNFFKWWTDQVIKKD